MDWNRFSAILMVSYKFSHFYRKIKNGNFVLANCKDKLLFKQSWKEVNHFEIYRTPWANLRSVSSLFFMRRWKIIFVCTNISCNCFVFRFWTFNFIIKTEMTTLTIFYRYVCSEKKPKNDEKQSQWNNEMHLNINSDSSCGSFLCNLSVCGD